MKKLITLFITLALIFNAYAVHERYLQGYSMQPSQVNTDKNETAISLMKDKVVYSITEGDNIKIYRADIINDIVELENAEEVPSMTSLGIYGTIAYDESKNKIYFSHYDKSTKNYALYESTQTSEDKWTSAKKLKIEGMDGYRKDGSPLVNAGWLYRAPGFSGFFNPTIAENGTRIYFSADFPIGEGGRDIWYIDRKGDDWGMPQNAGTGINTPGNEDYPFAADDNLLYFASTNNSDGGLDLFVSKRRDNVWSPAESLGSVYNSSVDDYNLIGNDKVMYFVSSRNTGNEDDIYRPAMLDIPPIAIAEPQPEDVPKVSMKTFPWKLFYFDFDKDLLTDEFVKELDALFVVMLDFIQDHDFIIRGHTDERGTDDYNFKLSARRANRIRNMLIDRGIPANKMVIEALGETQLVIKNAQTEEEHAANRRVEVDIVRK